MDAPGTTASAPDWENLKLDLHCPRCGYNLRGLPQPRCPECGLEFQWSEMIAGAQRKLATPSFEYHWRDRPIRSFFGTVGRALLPWRLWTETRMALEPQVRPLLALLLLVVLLEASCWFGRECALVCALHARWGRLRVWGRLLQVDFLGETWFLFGQLLIGVAFWGLLQIFQQTIGRYRIRQQQFLRVITLSCVALVAWHATMILVSGALETWWMLQPGWPTWWGAACDLIALCPFVLFAVSLAVGLSRYLRVRRGWLMGLASIIVFLLLLEAPDIAFTALLGTPKHVWGATASHLWPDVLYPLRMLVRGG